MPNNEFNKLRITKNDIGGVNISLDIFELKNVLEYELKSSNPGLAELSIKLMVEIDGIGN
ncbi:MAG: hypothetical protein E6590_17480 [Clostridiales bacterium]|nr:hypothetical protein [Clostridiales bacterium]